MKRGYVHQTNAGAFVPQLGEAARTAITRCFPALPIPEIESAAQWFYLERDRQRSESGPPEMRKTLTELDRNIARLLRTFDRLREQRLDSVVRQDASDSDAFSAAEESLWKLRRAGLKVKSRILPGSTKILASRMLVQRLAPIVRQAGLSIGDGTNDPLPLLLDIIFSDDNFKDTADARSVVREWKKSAENGR